MANYPTIKFVDDLGNVLPTDEDGIQHISQFRQSWQVCLSDRWLGKVRLLGNPSNDLLNVTKTNYWQFKNNQIPPSISRRSGIVTAMLIDEKGNNVEATKTKLVNHHLSLTDHQLDQMIADIGTLALSVSSCVSREISIPIGESGGLEDIGFQWLPYHGLLVTADALLDLASVVQQNWLALEKRPLKNIKIDAGIVNTSRIHTSPKLLVKAFTEPYRQSFMGMARTETIDCPENQFLCYVLDVYLQDIAFGLIKSLESIAIDDIPIHLIPTDDKSTALNNRKRVRNDDSFKEFRDNIQKRAKLRTKEVARFQQSVRERINKLKKSIEWSKYARNSLLLRNVKTPSTTPTPSLRLIGSPAYGAIYACFSASQGHALEKLQNVLYLFESIHRGFVRPVWEIYEIWCFVSIYSAFVLYGGMYPDESGNLFEKIRLVDKVVKVPKNEPFRLVKKLSNGKELKVVLTYEPIKYNSRNELRTPDILIEISIDGLSLQKFCFDAKYRNYTDQGYEWFTKDVLDTAKERYKQQLELKAGFILHSDKNYDYWGEVQFSRFLKEKFEKEIQDSEYVGHKFGAIALTPDNAESQLKKIIRLFLQYHLHESLIDTCISCGYTLKPIEDVFASWQPDRMIGGEAELIRRVISNESGAGKGTGVYCGCPQCGDFWVVNSCYGTHHHLLKFSNYFHRKSDHPKHSDRWMFICPECGSDPSPEDLRSSGGYPRSYRRGS
jgi:hypothetical protein